MLAVWIAILSGPVVANEVPAPLRNVNRIVFLGDSITQGGDYVTDFDCWLVSHAIAIEVLNLGLASETASDLTESENAAHKRSYGFGRPLLNERLDRVLAATKPDLIIACYGMNDGGSLPTGEAGTKRFAAAITNLRNAALRAGVKRVVLCTPPPHDAKGNSALKGYDEALTRYSAWLLSKKAEGWDVVDIHGPMRKALDQGRAQDPNFAFAGDGVHPGREGHWLMATSILSQWLGANLDGVASADHLFQRDGKEIRDFIRARMTVKFSAWMTLIGHTRPGVSGGPGEPIGPTISEANVKAAEITSRIAGTLGGRLVFGDPANVRSPSKWAVGQANRAADLDALPLFQKPPPGFGIVPFFWWIGDPLTQQRLAWELKQMEGMGVAGFQINYAHSDRGGLSYGLTYPSEPPLFTAAWWKLTGRFMQMAKKQDAGISLSDYTLGFGQGYCMDEMLREHPELCGQILRLRTNDVSANNLVVTNIGGQQIAVYAEKVEQSLDPMNPLSGPEYANKFFGQFEDHFPGESGKGLNFFFSDELEFRVHGNLWNPHFASEFKQRKGYDLVPELPALFFDIGPRTPKVRLDYNDVKVALSEEGFFKPVFDWHQQRGMTMGCDHGGRGRDVIEFGDYFRTQRWNQGPGADQPGLGKDLIKAKVASSIAHLYERPRVWLEGYYGSGWGTTSAGLVDATFSDYVMGYNLLGIHGMYYATHGGWWEWAPPDNTFRMPYWKHLRGFMGCVQRLSCLLSQGHHRCDIAILYPVAPMAAGMGGPEAVKLAFRTGEQLYAKSIDFDFMDFESLARAQVIGKELHVSGEIFQVLILPAMKAVRHSTLQKALEFHRAGGIVIALGALPKASDRIGRDDPELEAMVRELFPGGPSKDVFARLPGRDYAGPGYIQHRKIGPRDLYAIYNAPKGTECFFRATGQVEMWDPWTGETRQLAVQSQTVGGTKLKLPLTEKEIQLIVFSPGSPKIAIESPERPPDLVNLEGDWEFELQPTSDNRFGDFHWPPSPEWVGAEVRQLWYCEGDNTNAPWRKVTCSFGPQFFQYEARPANPATYSEGGKPHEFSWRWGLESDPGHQGYHGLKEQVHDEFIALGTPQRTGTGTRYEADGAGSYLWTTVYAPHDLLAFCLTGNLKPDEVWLNGKIVTGPSLKLQAGANPLLLHYEEPGATYFAVTTNEVPPAKVGSLATRWWNQPAVMPFDVRPLEQNPVGWYRFVSPPGLRAITVPAHGRVQAWADDQPLVGKGKLKVPKPSVRPVTVRLRIEQERGFYGGAALLEPIKLDCGRGQFALGDWSKNEGLLSYSGGAWYRKTVTLGSAKQVVLNLGQVVASAEVRVNGNGVGVKVAPPWTLDITKFVKAGENRIEVLVCNTMANHYTTIPTRYRGSPLSGLFGPVQIELKR